MRGPGLDHAIEKVGIMSALSSRVGRAPLSMSIQTHVPPEQGKWIEGLQDVNTISPRADFFGEPQKTVDIDEVDAARAREYALLSALLVRAPDAALLEKLSLLQGDATPLGIAHIALAEAAGQATVASVEREFFELFIGMGRGELMPYGSYYLTGFLNERPLARLREDLGKFGIERVEKNVEPEDQAATLCEIMSGLADGRFGASAESDQKIFEKHVAPWMGRFFADLERAEAARFYRAVGTVGRLLVEIEREAFAIS